MSVKSVVICRSITSLIITLLAFLPLWAHIIARGTISGFWGSTLQIFGMVTPPMGPCQIITFIALVVCWILVWTDG